MARDRIHGGRADGMSPADFDSRQLRIGTAHELEHTNDRAKAREIAMDHLAEDPDYYERLEAMEREAEDDRLREALHKDV